MQRLKRTWESGDILFPSQSNNWDGDFAWGYLHVRSMHFFFFFFTNKEMLGARLGIETLYSTLVLWHTWDICQSFILKNKFNNFIWTPPIHRTVILIYLNEYRPICLSEFRLRRMRLYFVRDSVGMGDFMLGREYGEWQLNENGIKYFPSVVIAWA